MKKNLLLFICILFISVQVYAQSCDCYIANAYNTFPPVPMGLGTDTGGAPFYRCNNCSSIPIKLPFNFCFYGKEYDTVYINNKGSISFVNPVFNYPSAGLPEGNDTLMLAAFLADIDNRGVDPFSTICYQLTPTHLIVQWSTVGYNTFDDDLYDNFQVTITNGNDSLLPAGNNVSYCYWLMQWASADSSGGTGGFGGIPARVGVNKGDHINYAQIGEFNFPGSAYNGPFSATGGIYWLINKSFIFNTCVTGNDIPPVIINPNTCDTLTVCALDTGIFSVSFLCAQQSQTATLSVSSGGLQGITTTTTNNASIYTAKMQVIPPLKDTGIYQLHIVATDNSFPALKDSIQYTVIVTNCNIDTNTGTGINKLTAVNEQWSIYPNPGNGIFLISANNPQPIANSCIEIYNLLGEEVYSKSNIQNPTFSINLSSQPPGIYFYLIRNPDETIAGQGKLIIQ